MTRRSLTLLAALAIPAHADVAYDNFGPNTTFSGNGFLVMGPQFSNPWSHAFPITPTLSGEISTVTIALQHLSGPTNSYILELRADAGGSPGAVIATVGQFSGFTSDPPAAVSFTANPGVSITAGTPYWVYARGEADAFGTWLGSPTLGGVRAFSRNGGQTFTVEPILPSTGQGAIRIEVASSGPACYANCDNSTGTPALTANDFQCFINQYAAGSSSANCDASTGNPALTANDFQCFINAYAAGCS